MIAEQERRWIWWFIILVMGLTTIPYLLGFALQGDQWRFTGFLFGVEDGNSYIAKMLSGAAGAWLFRTPYTAYPQSGMLAFVPYLLLGKLTAPPAQHEQLLVLFQLFRWAGGIAMIWATYRFIAYFIQSIALRRMGTVMAILGGGLGWLSVLGLQNLWSSRLPLEFYSPETFGFLSLLGLPHLEMARALLLFGFVFYLESSTDDKKAASWKAGCTFLLAGMMQPLTVVTGWIVLLVHQIVIFVTSTFIHRNSFQVYWNESKKRWINTCLTVAISSLIVLYTMWAFVSDPFLSKWNAQNLIISPPIGDYLLAFGLALPFVLLAFVNYKKLHSEKALFLAGWIAVFPMMAYAPLNLQRRLPDGIWVALVVSALVGLAFIRSRWLLIFSKIWLYSSLFSSLIFFVGGSFTVTQLQTPMYRRQGEVQAFTFIQQTAPSGAVVLANYESANPLAAWAPIRTVIGHGPESANLKEIQPRVDKVFNSAYSIPECQEFLREFNVEFILVTPSEGKFESNRLIEAGLLSEIFNQAGYQVFKVN